VYALQCARARSATVEVLPKRGDETIASCFLVLKKMKKKKKQQKRKKEEA